MAPITIALLCFSDRKRLGFPHDRLGASLEGCARPSGLAHGFFLTLFPPDLSWRGGACVLAHHQLPTPGSATETRLPCATILARIARGACPRRRTRRCSNRPSIC